MIIAKTLYHFKNTYIKLQTNYRRIKKQKNN